MTELSSSTETIASEDQAIKERNKAKKKITKKRGTPHNLRLRNQLNWLSRVSRASARERSPVLKWTKPGEDSRKEQSTS